jgi:hypothetical protein
MAKETGQRIEVTRRPDGSWAYAAEPPQGATKEASPAARPKMKVIL